MCEPISIGIAIGAATGAISSAVTGGNVLEGALMGAVMGGVTGGMGGLSGGSSFISGVGNIFPTAGIGLQTSALAAGVSANALMGFAATSLVGGIGLGMLTPQQQDYNFANTGLRYTPQPYNTQHTKVTGSGGRQAAAVLASEIKQAKKLRQRQAEVADYGLGMDITGTGLQIA